MTDDAALDDDLQALGLQLGYDLGHERHSVLALGCLLCNTNPHDGGETYPIAPAGGSQAPGGLVSKGRKTAPLGAMLAEGCARLDES